MNWSAKLDQQRNALLLTFYMFIAMTLVVIRAGLDVRGLSASFPFDPKQYGDRLAHPPLAARQGDVSSGHDPPPLDLSNELDRLYATALALLGMARAVACRLAGLERDVFELMKLADAMTRSLYDEVCLRLRPCDLSRKRLDAP